LDRFPKNQILATNIIQAIALDECASMQGWGSRPFLFATLEPRLDALLVPIWIDRNPNRSSILAFKAGQDYISKTLLAQAT
jgi:hypothetical protein